LPTAFPACVSSVPVIALLGPRPAQAWDVLTCAPTPAPQSHVIGMNEVATKACKKHKVSPGSARLLNNSFAQTVLLQLLPAKHAKCHAVVVANAALFWDGQQPDVQTVEAALLMRELQVYSLAFRTRLLGNPPPIIASASPCTPKRYGGILISTATMPSVSFKTGCAEWLTHDHPAVLMVMDRRRR